MNRRTFAFAFGSGVALLFAPCVTLAEDHLMEAIKHTKEAIQPGKAGNTDVVVMHAEAALAHAKAAEKEKANLDIKEGIAHLEVAIYEGHQKDAISATKHMEEALTNLEAGNSPKLQ
jgi:hypothetical protein